jgi:hypothetical protein
VVILSGGNLGVSGIATGGSLTPTPSTSPPPPPTSFVLMEDGTSKVLMEDGSSKILLEA